MSEPHRYAAAGGVVIHDDRVLVLLRPHRDEVRLPKGHIEPGEDAAAAALREVTEESGYADLEIVGDLGNQVLDFVRPTGERVIRAERFYLMRLRSRRTVERAAEEQQFTPVWMTADDARNQLTYVAEREWLRRALAAV